MSAVDETFDRDVRQARSVMFSAVLLSLGVVFVAELGDKSQLMTMTYALRHRWWVVLSGVGIAAFGVHGLSVTIGHFLGLTLPGRPIAFAAAIAFLLFAGWTWHDGRKCEADDGVETVAEPRYVILAVMSSFVLAELGDKTMLATVALASHDDWAGVWIGATIGMVLADGVAIIVGRLLHARLPERLLQNMAAVLFGLFGVWMLFDDALGWPRVAVTAAALVAVGSLVAAAAGVVRHRRARRETAPARDSSPESAA